MIPPIAAAGGAYELVIGLPEEPFGRSERLLEESRKLLEKLPLALGLHLLGVWVAGVVGHSLGPLDRASILIYRLLGGDEVVLLPLPAGLVVAVVVDADVVEDLLEVAVEAGLPLPLEPLPHLTLQPHEGVIEGLLGLVLIAEDAQGHTEELGLERGVEAVPSSLVSRPPALQ